MFSGNAELNAKHESRALSSWKMANFDTIFHENSSEDDTENTHISLEYAHTVPEAIVIRGVGRMTM